MNKAPLKPVKSLSVMHQVQIDLVDMRSSKVTVGSETFSYILVALDVFSRFIFLRALKCLRRCALCIEFITPVIRRTLTPAKRSEIALWGLRIPAPLYLLW